MERCFRRRSAIARTQFAIGNPFGKLSFIDGDIKADTNFQTARLKRSARQKFSPANVSSRTRSSSNLAHPILLCNNIPSLADLRHGMRRLQVVHFRQIFAEHEIDRQLFKRIATNELSRVLNRALEGWKRLQTRGRSIKSVDMVKARTQLVAHANPLQGFIDECCEKADDGTTRVDEVYTRYKASADDNGYTMTHTKPTVRRNLEHMNCRVPRHASGRVIIGLKFR